MKKIDMKRIQQTVKHVRKNKGAALISYKRY